MKLICNKNEPDCIECPHSIPHQRTEECQSDCTDTENCKCIPNITYTRKQKLKNLLNTMKTDSN